MGTRVGSWVLQESKYHSCPQGKYHQLDPWEVRVQTLLETISNPIKDNKVTGISQHRVIKEKSCLHNPYGMKWLALWLRREQLMQQGFEYTHKPWQPSPASPGVSSGIPRPRSSTQAQPGAFSCCLCWAGGMLVSSLAVPDHRHP